jgi:hypothetical protein
VPFLVGRFRRRWRTPLAFSFTFLRRNFFFAPSRGGGYFLIIIITRLLFFLFLSLFSIAPLVHLSMMMMM